MRRLALIAAAALALPGIAAAHVTVTPATAESGKPATLTFKVANERDAATTRVQVFFPEDAPVAVQRVAPHPGWRHLVQAGNGGTEYVDWVAATAGAQIAGDETASFTLTTGPLPKADRLVFKVLQTYADGTVVRWIQEQAPGGDPPERPAPTVDLTGTGSAAPAPAAKGGSNGTAVWVWVVVAAALWAIAGGTVLYLRRRR